MLFYNPQFFKFSNNILIKTCYSLCREVLARASVLQTLVSVPNGFHGFELIQGAYKVTRWDMDETELKLASLVLL